jgi:succinoglycan biosynthesis protein ExoM
LNELAFQETAGKFTYSIVVVDNDSRQSAKVVIDAIKLRSPIRIQYYVEPQQNIALARNKAVSNSTGELIALIDDDEFPTNTWLLDHYDFLCRTDADGSLGPVLPSFDCPPPRWIIRGKFFNRPTYRTGKLLRWVETRTGNVLLRRDCFSQPKYLFDPKLGSGGEDKDFFKRAIEAGRVFYWCAEASVFEHVSEARCRRSFMLRRALLRGKADAQGNEQGLLSIIKSLAAIMINMLALPVTLVIAHDIFMWTVIRGCDHFGKIATICGIDVSKEKYIVE